MSAESSSRAGNPVASGERISSLDLIRGVAVLGILPMNALDFGLEPAAYFNVSADGVRQPLDWVVGVLTMVFVDQKMMALFSLLFGVGVVVFAERAAAKGRRVVALSLWRFAILLVVGLVHAAFWTGDVLVLYALCAPVVLLLRRLPVRVLLGLGVAIAMTGTLAAPFVQSAIGSDPAELGYLWIAGADTATPVGEAWFIGNAAGRALGLMLIGVALYRLGVVQGDRDDGFYRRWAAWGIGAGAAVTAVGTVVYVASDWAPGRAIVGAVPTGIGTIPMALGYMALIILWGRAEGRTTARLRRTGQMALTNYLMQSVLGLVTLRLLLDGVDLTRTVLLVWIVGVWALEVWWSDRWLARFRYGPFEWAWRCATYRARLPLRR